MCGKKRRDWVAHARLPSEANNTAVVDVGVRGGGQEARVNRAQPWISVGTAVNSLRP